LPPLLFPDFAGWMRRNKAKKSQAQKAKVAEEEKPFRPVQVERMEIPLDDPVGKAALSRNFYFIFDGSGSMGEKREGKVKLDGAKEAVHKFMNKVPEDANLGLYIFDASGTREVVPLEAGNRAGFLQAIDAVRHGGTTPLAESIIYGTNQLIKRYKRQLGYGDYRLIVVTDGQANRIPEAAQYSMRYGMPIYAIGFYIEGDHPLRAYAMSYREANNYADLEKALEDSLAELPSFDPTEFGE